MAKEKDSKDLLELMLTGGKVTETVHTRRGDFVLVFPLPSTLRQIEIDLADMLGNKPITSFTQEAINNARAYATLRYVVESGPEWWEALESPDQCPDNNIIADLYRRYLQFYAKTQNAMAQGKYRGDVGKVRLADNPPSSPVGDGPLSGSSDRPEVSGADR